MTNVKNAGNELKNVVIVRGGGDLASGTIKDCIVADTVFWFWSVRSLLQSEEWYLSAKQFMTDSLP